IRPDQISRGAGSLDHSITVSLLKGSKKNEPLSLPRRSRMAVVYGYPNDAWLMFVSAAEVAALHWRATEVDNDHESLFRQLRPKWAERLDQTGDTSLVRDMAIHWSDLLGSTNRFLKFLLAHLPIEPTERPPVGKIDWSDKGIRTALNQIYEYRSLALHAGTPFPAPMCSAPLSVSNENNTPTERPYALAMASRGGVWKYEDMPMHLHVFAYIVRGALMNWWDGLKRRIEPEQSPSE
ncbi:MAG TPA: hypothetical protein VGM05_11375, partial [Planctomycetaceae bacterium]